MKKISLETANNMMDAMAYTICMMKYWESLSEEQLEEIISTTRQLFIDYCEAENIEAIEEN